MSHLFNIVHKFPIRVVPVVVLLLLLFSCDDTTSTLGVDMMPSTDLVRPHYKVYPVATQSYAVGDAVLARTNQSYLGRFTDPETHTTVKSEFLAQFRCDEGYSLPSNIYGDSCTRFDLRLFVKDFVGDSLQPFKLSVYELNRPLDPNADYYTDIDPEQYYDTQAEPIATKWFTLSDRTISDADRQKKDYNNNIRVTLPHTLGTKIIRDYQQNPQHFASTATWLKSGNPCSNGLYFKLEYGDGAMAYVDVVQLNFFFRYYDTTIKRDTVGMSTFAATDAVVQATRFQNTNLQPLLDDTQATYLKSPAAIFTQATIPADQINVNDTINSAKLTFVRYNSVGQSTFPLSAPRHVLLVRLDEYKDGFFENYRVNDGRETYLASFNANDNTYTFNNIARLLTRMAREKSQGIAGENWNKVLIIPVVPTTDSEGKVVKLDHDFSMSSARLVGGDGQQVQLEVVYTTIP